VSASHLAVVCQLADWRGVVPLEEMKMGTPMAAAAGPLFEEISTVAVGARLGRQLTLRAMAACGDEEGAGKVAETAQALCVLGRNAIDHVVSRASSLGLPDPDLTMPFFEAAKELMESVHIRQDGTTVRAEASVPVDLRLVTGFLKSAEAARQAARRTQSANNLRQLGLAMHYYHDSYKRFPPAVLYGPDGKTPYSWRVALLPYLEQKALYDEYRFDEPWDSPHNRKIAETVVPIYRSPADKPGSAYTSYFALVGPGTAFGGEEGTRFADIQDGSSNTVLFVEARRAVPWTKPEDIAYDPEKPIPALGGFFPRGFNAAFGDGSVHFLSDSIDEKALRALIGIADHQPVDHSRLRSLLLRRPR
jgi:hypothetical protein